MDNDCDGEIDESTVLVNAPLNTNQEGVCRGFNQICVAGEWSDSPSTMIDGYEETETACDTIDSDCDGEVDEDLDAPLSSLQEGLCAGLRQQCVSGRWVEPNYVDVMGFEASEVSCDGVDSDCDGEVDEDLLPPSSDRQGGVCAPLVKVCGGVRGWVEPNYLEADGFEVSESVCDGLDSDCDGQVDEELNAPLSGIQDGVCVGQRKVCNGIQGWQEPNYTEIDGFENEETLCDGADNDCDGAIDEGLEEGPLTDAQSGRCQGLRMSCQEGQWYDPSASTREAETCNGIDDDCDARIDEGLDAMAPLATLQDGACQGARRLCVDGQWADPEPPQGDPPCDGVDNDCDGEVDEDAVSGERCNGVDDDCDGMIDEALIEPPPQASLQAGVCQGSLKRCLDGQWSDPPRSAIAGYMTPDDACDGVDTDCDGFDCPPPPPPPAPCDPRCPELSWVTLSGGILQMGSDLIAEAQPVHDVEVPSFALTRAEITKRQYLACVDAGACEAPTCTVSPSDQPMGCVRWRDAYQFASWVGGRLPSFLIFATFTRLHPVRLFVVYERC